MIVLFSINIAARSQVLCGRNAMMSKSTNFEAMRLQDESL
jgi:hypothetical protein